MSPISKAMNVNVGQIFVQSKENAKPITTYKGSMTEIQSVSDLHGLEIIHLKPRLR